MTPDFVANIQILSRFVGVFTHPEFINVPEYFKDANIIKALTEQSPADSNNKIISQSLLTSKNVGYRNEFIINIIIKPPNQTPINQPPPNNAAPPLEIQKF